MYNIILFISGGIIVILIQLLVSLCKKIRYLKVVLNDIEAGNTNRRIMLNNNFKLITDLVNSINNILEHMSKTENHNIKQTRMLKKMISNISHDFKTPLTSLIGYIELIEESKELSLEELNEYLEVVKNKAYFLNSILDNFFYLSKLESNDEKFNLDNVNLKDLIQEQIIFFYTDFKNVGINPSLQIPKEDIFILADKNSIIRILSNLLSNSLKYGTDGGQVGISLSEDSRYVYIEIWDNGKGIPEKDIPFIFERLYTIDDSRNLKLSGSGIGLSIVKHLVEYNKGTITVKSDPFKRTSFTLKFHKV